MRMLVTGCYGFIGAHFIKHVLVEDQSVQVIGFGRCSDQTNRRRLVDPAVWPNLKVVHGDLCDTGAVSGLCEGIDVVVNFAAKTFVDHSLKDRIPFIESNIIGADNLMEDATRYKVKRFIQISTDEVYGQILKGSYKEDALLQPRNPYSWSKACADLNGLQRHRTSGFPCIVTRTENNFGPMQHRQKVLPTFARCSLGGESLPVYGDGQHVRCWLHVGEHCRALWHLVGVGIPGEVYHIAGEEELTNYELAQLVLRALDLPTDRIRFVPDNHIRPGHDRRYSLDCSKLRATGFEIKQDVRQMLADTVRWYADNQAWIR